MNKKKIKGILPERWKDLIHKKNLCKIIYIVEISQVHFITMNKL